MSSNFEVAQEDEQKKREAEKQTVREAKNKRDQHQKKVEDADAKYTSAGRWIDELSEETELLKVQQHEK